MRKSVQCCLIKQKYLLDNSVRDDLAKITEFLSRIIRHEVSEILNVDICDGFFTGSVRRVRLCNGSDLVFTCYDERASADLLSMRSLVLE